jgi:putative addiction module CopG family antidote
MPETPKSLNVSLTPELTRFITSRVASGRYQSASEVVRAALRLLERDEAGLLPENASKRPEPKIGQTANE